MIFQCSRCHKFFDKKYNYDIHIGRKIPCKEVLDIKDDRDDINENEDESTDNGLSIVDNLRIIKDNGIIQENSRLRCLICNKIYKHMSGLCKHKKLKHPQKALLSRLSSKELLPNYDNDIQNIKQDVKLEIEQVNDIIMKQARQIDNLNKKNKELEILVKTSKSKKCIINNNTNNTNNQTNNINNGQIINNHFNIVSFGDEDITKLTHEEKLSVLKSKDDALLNLVIKMHLNERLPEFQNVLINNIKSNYGSIVDNNKIVLTKKDKIISDLISYRIEDLRGLVVEYKQTKHLKQTDKEILDNLIIYIDETYLVNKDIDGNTIRIDKESIKKNKIIYDELIFAFYNNRALVDKTLKRISDSKDIGLMDMLLDV